MDASALYEYATSLPLAIPFEAIGPDDAEPTLDRLLAEAEARLQAVRDATDLTWQTTAQALDRVTEPLDRAWAVIGHLRSVVHTDAWEQAYMRLVPRVSSFYASI
ncbi:MAG TPA: hypothetical protein PKA64_25130, partial [Myxococcota bacterium]|nr:hypothetical protein [Myxococcota bacterium]